MRWKFDTKEKKTLFSVLKVLELFNYNIAIKF